MADVNSRQSDALGGLPISRGIIWTAWAVFIFLILPTLIIIPMSFGDKNELYFPPRSLSFFLYKEFFFQSVWMETTIQSFKVATVSTVLGLFFGVTSAYGVVRATFRGKKVFGVLLLSPLFVPHIVIALGLYIYFASLGLQGTTLSLILGHTVFVTPFVMVVVMGALRSVDPNLEAVARVMGAGRIYTFRRVTLPLLKPALIAGGLFAFLMSFDELVISFFLSGFGTQTLPVKMYDSIVLEISPVLSAISVLLTMLAFVICVTITIIQNPDQEHAITKK
jgi:putative spermidine/putrescine transport system permease protein